MACGTRPWWAPPGEDADHVAHIEKWIRQKLLQQIGADVVRPPWASGLFAGGRMPRTARVAALLAFGPPERFVEVLSAGLHRRTPRTIIAPGMLGSELEAIRASGVAIEREESTVGITCVAAPVHDPQGTAVTTISITGWADRFDPDGYAPAVRTAALGISRTLGYRVPAACSVLTWSQESA